MTTFDEREKAFENQYQHDQDLLFRIQSRRAKLLGLWAAQHLGLSGAEADTYAKQLVAVDLDEPGVQDIVRKVVTDFGRKGIDISQHRIEREAEHLLAIAREQVNKE